MAEQQCPDCNLTLVWNKYGDLVCPNCGIIKHHKEKRDPGEVPSYLG